MSLRDNGHEDSHFLQYPNRYIDDLLSLNDSGYIERVYKDIYPDVMVLNKTNNTPDKATYLDINIEIINGKFVTKIYDKRRDFNFKIISLPHISGNVPVTPTYGVFIIVQAGSGRCVTYRGNSWHMVFWDSIVP